jgi:hypothetical protein
MHKRMMLSIYREHIVSVVGNAKKGVLNVRSHTM